MAYRQLKDTEISQLEKQHCEATDWKAVEVAENFSPENIRHVRFSGHCRIGKMDGKLMDASGNERQAGIYHTGIHASEIGDNVYISDTGMISAYRISSGVLIEHSGSLVMEGSSTFGNGTELDVLNEGGGRELMIYDRLTAQVAWMLVMCRHDKALIGKLNDLIGIYVGEKESDQGYVGQGSRISHAGIIRNVWIGDHVTISGAVHLEEGTILGDSREKTLAGTGVQARHFILLSGSAMDQDALIENCFIGQGVRIGKQFSAENSVFFANSEGFHGEAVSLFAGPYTVTHHKSTLLIAGMYSFYNAGSGTNQSNHMYKLGPVHQGIVERGSKTGSFSYLLWPCKVGPFSVVIGKHASNFDTSELPFSYITVEGDKSMLTPAMNLLTVGTRRDSEKWPKRDRRKGDEKLDLINFELLNPFVVSSVIGGIDVLNELYEKTSRDQEFVNYKGVRIKRLMLKSCRKYYEMALHIFIGDQLMKRMELAGKDGLKDLFLTETEAKGGWLDMSGMVISGDAFEKMTSEIGEPGLNGIPALEELLRNYAEGYPEQVWAWTVQVMRERMGIDPENPEPEKVRELIEAWKDNALRLNNMILSDAKKEFDPSSRIGFGALGGQEVSEADFESVRGTYEDNSFVKGLREEQQAIEKKAETGLAWLVRK